MCIYIVLLYLSGFKINGVWVMSDIDKEFKSNDEALIDKCISILEVKAVTVRKHKAGCLYTRRKIEDIRELTRLKEECEL